MMRSQEDIDKIAELEAERDALAAHVERCRALLDEALPCHGVEADHELLCVLSDVLEVQSPVTSIARLKAQWQAEALDGCVEYLRGQGVYVGMAFVQEYANERRQQAEPDWDGEGLPPVGAAFEFSENGDSWEQRVMLFDDGITCLMAHRTHPANRWHYKSADPDLRFRPICTADEGCRTLYRAGYRKE